MQLSYYIINSGPLKAVNPIPSPISNAELNKSGKSYETLNNNPNKSNKLNPTNEFNKQITQTIHMENEQYPTENIPKTNTPEVFGSLVSLNDYTPTLNRDREQ